MTATSFRELPLDCLYAIRKEALSRRGAKAYPDASPSRQLELAWEEEQDDLREAFLQSREIGYLFAGSQNLWRAMCRLERVEGGFLLSSLETAKENRRQGFARHLVNYAQAIIAETGLSLYSHVAKSNIPSLRLHEACGFQKQLDYARLLDGSTTGRYVTLCWSAPKFGKTEKSC